MFGIGFPELLVILVILLLLFGGKNIPEIARNLGKGISAFKKGVKEEEKPERNNGKDDSKEIPPG
ncbi:MAG: twin-arginine translocase TatA/TatE family subunit [Candidatus Aureabacteria bacterium]|nr:twin-arginine translocase TatA/TatE family subunit [Candidatus Auribacterota bacterium]